jgi:hypothetical protein
VHAVTGSVAAPVHTGWLLVSAPLAVLEADPDELRVRLRPRWLGALGSPDPPISRPGYVYACAVSGIERVLRGPRSVVFVPRRGRSCRFTAAPQRLSPIIDELSARGVPVDTVKNTVLFAFTI